MKDLRRFDRITAAVLMPVGPIAVAVLRFLVPNEPVADAVSRDPAVYRAILTLGAVASFTLVPGAYAALTLVRRYRPVLSAWVGALLIPGYLALAALSAVDAIIVAGHDVGVEPAVVARLYGAVGELPILMITFLVFLVGHIVGTVLLGILAFRARLMPRAVAVLLAISQPLHLVAVIIASNALDLVAWGLTALGMAFLARRVLLTPDEEWDLPALERP
jgi:hypothetical protein